MKLFRRIQFLFLSGLLLVGFPLLAAIDTEQVQILRKGIQATQVTLSMGVYTPELLRKIKAETQAETIAEFLPHLPENLRKRYTGMTKSFSLQAASPENPRLFFYSPGGDLVLTFNGHPSQRGYGSIEMMSFDWKELKFKFERMIFKNDEAERFKWLANEISRLQKLPDSKEKTDAIQNIQAEIRHEGAMTQIPETAVNPPVCMGCHKGVQANGTLDPQPNWDHYNYWPNTLNPIHNGGLFFDPRTGDNVAREDILKTYPPALSPTHPRYKSVVHKTYDDTYGAEEELDLYGHYENESSMESMLTERLNFLNFIRVYRMLSPRPDFKKLKYDLVATYSLPGYGNIYESECGYVLDKISPEAIRQAMDHKFKGMNNWRTVLAKDLLKTYGVNPHILTLNFLVGPGNDITMPGTIGATLTWVFLQDELQTGIFKNRPRSEAYAEGYSPSFHVPCPELKQLATDASSAFVEHDVNPARSIAQETATGSFTFETLRQWIYSGQVKSVEEMLEKLPEVFKSNFSFVYDTRSTQQHASFTEPRGIMFNNDASLIMTFASAPDVKGGKMVEVIEYDKSAKKYNFRMIDFAQNAPVNDNPQGCVRCHNGKPVWDTYPDWPGIYGNGHETEQKNFWAFYNSNRTHARYKHFLKDGLKYGTTRDGSLGVDQNNVNLSNHISFQRADMILDSLLKKIEMPKLGRLLDAIFGTDWVYVTSLIDKSNPATSRFRLDENDIREFEEMKVKYAEQMRVVFDVFQTAGYPISQAELDVVLATIQVQQDRYYASRKLRMERVYGRLPYGLNEDVGDKYNKEPIAFLELLTKRLGVPGPETWSTTLEQKSYDFTSGADGFRDLYIAFKKRDCASALRK